MANKQTELTDAERDQLAYWRAQGVGIRECARRLTRGASTLSAELKRNSLSDGTYVAIYAKTLARQRQAQRYHTTPLKNPWLYAHVLAQLRAGDSPEQIDGRLTRLYPTDPTKHISYECLYAFIYSQEHKALRLWEYLPRKRVKRRKQQGRAVKRSHIPERVSLHHRPEEVVKRWAFGHWEGDTIEGRRGDKDGIHTEVERVSRKLLACKVPQITSAATSTAQVTLFSALPACARGSTTLDNGRENHEHTVLHALGIATYFADPYSSWQRGTNENTNGLVRRYLPKKTSFATLAPAELDDIVEELNNRPRKCLGYATPNEVFLEQVHKASVRLTS